MFRNFNWKKYCIRVAVAWAIFIVLTGFVVEFSSYAKEDTRWVVVGTFSDPDSTFYVLRNGVTVNVSGNAVITVKTDITDVGVVYAKWEIDCKQKVARMIQMGSSLDAMINVEHEWITPVKDSVIHRISKPICSFGGI